MLPDVVAAPIGQAPASLHIADWSRGAYSATRSANARSILAALEPHVVAAAYATTDAAETIASFDDLVRRLGAGSHLFASLAADPVELETLLELLARAPRLTATLAKRPDLFDALMRREPSADVVSPAEITRTLATLRSRCATDGEILRGVQQFTRKQQFLIAARAVLGWMPLAKAADAFSRLALAVVPTLAAMAERRFQTRNGRPTGSEWALVALGKFGSSELSATSDLDLMLVYEIAGADGNTQTAALPPTQYFNKLAQDIIAILSAPAGDGALFDVDFRLRPWGKKGPIATRLSTLRDYLANDAWTYERMAMTRARVITGSPQFAAAIETIIRDALHRPAANGALRTDVLEMHALIHSAAASHDRSDAAGQWDIKHARGGLIDVEFAAQYLMLRHAGERTDLICTAPAAALRALHAAGHLDADDFAILAAAHACFNDVMQATRAACLPGPLPEGMSRALAASLPTMLGEASVDALEETLRRHQASVRNVFARLTAA
jgi:[glutamine synthetase] adenylyltransferase / [glutamine synthetase]-adenylyl-L-tyrosine phosphorylase